MASGTIKQLPIKIDSPTVIESMSFNEDLNQFSSSQARLLELIINLTGTAQTATGYKIFQIVFSKTRIQLFGQKLDDSWETFGTIS